MGIFKKYKEPEEKEVAFAPAKKVKKAPKVSEGNGKCKFHKEHKRHCVDCEKF